MVINTRFTVPNFGNLSKRLDYVWDASMLVRTGKNNSCVHTLLVTN